LRHVFFAERAAQSRGKNFPAPAREIKSAIVVGGGTMGAAISYALALAGLRVHVVETDAAGQVRAEANVAKLVIQGAERGAIADVDALRAHFGFGVGYGALPPVDLAIEAAFESLEVKQVIFAALQAALPTTTILATNTSYLDVNQLAEGIDDPGRFVGLHFFAPAHVMKLLEIVRGNQTSDVTLGQAFALAKRLGKMPVVSGVCDGFIGNRILSRYRMVVDQLMIEGSCPKGVDDAMRSFGMAMGPYEAQDMSGLDIAYANRKRQNLKQRMGARYVPIADTLVEDLKRLGRKTGAGWYDYDAAGKPVESDVVTHAIYRASDAAGITRTAMPKDNISERAVLAMIMEAIRILDEGIAARPQDIDLVMVHGYGFPRWRGGLMHHADCLTPAVVLLQITALAKGDPQSWSVPGLLQRLVRDGRSFDSLNREGSAP
jgi:3-hydroxyacyl-CoA dehydrogenase